MQFEPPKDPSFRSQAQPDSCMAAVEQTHRIFREDINEVLEWQTKYAGRKEMTLAVPDKLWLSTRNLKTSRPSKKLDNKCTGWYMANTKIINMNADNPDMPSAMRNHHVFHVSLLDHYTPPVRGQSSSEPHPVIVRETEEWEVDRILDSRQCYRKLHHLMQWASDNHMCRRWEPAEHLQNTQDLVNVFHQDRPDLPREYCYRVRGWRYGGHGSSLDVSLYLFLHFLLFPFN